MRHPPCDAAPRDWKSAPVAEFGILEKAVFQQKARRLNPELLREH